MPSARWLAAGVSPFAGMADACPFAIPEASRAASGKPIILKLDIIGLLFRTPAKSPPHVKVPTSAMKRR
jgi:hypothetical protein